MISLLQHTPAEGMLMVYVTDFVHKKLAEMGGKWQVRLCNISLLIQCVRETLHVFDFNLKENALRYFDADFAA